jgi:hypothetical protein
VDIDTGYRQADVIVYALLVNRVIAYVILMSKGYEFDCMLGEVEDIALAN